jgi:cobalt-zinc-cadmium efflux system membrane fusion protein
VAFVQNDMANEVPREPLSLRSQGVLVGAAALAAAAGVLLFLLVPGQGAAPDSGRRMARLVPGLQQSSAMQFETVRTRTFRTETVTDGYVAANGGWASSATAPVGRGMPVLQGQSADMIQAEGDLATARAQLVAARANEQRQHALYLADGAALKDWQQAQVDATTAASALSAARNKLRVLGKSDQDILTLERANAAGVGRIFSIGDISLVWLVANVREADAAHVHLGDQAEVTLPALAGKKLLATIAYKGEVIDTATHRLAVAALYKNSDHALSPNMLANFDILDRDSAVAPAVPRSAILYEGDQARLWVVGSRGDFTMRSVKVGRIRDGYAEITNGLSAGERIVTGGALFLDQASTGG